MENRHDGIISEIDVIDVKLPSGSEVNGAAFHPAVPHSYVSRPAGMRSWKSKLDDVRGRGMAKVHELKHTAVERGTVMKSTLQHTVARASANVRTGAHDGVARVNESMRANPMKWAGIAAGSGVVLGLVSRFIDRRRHLAAHRMPQIVIVESTC